MRKIDFMNEFNIQENREKWNAQSQVYLDDKEKMRKLVNEAMKKAEHKKDGPIDYTGEDFLLLLHLAKDYVEDAYREIPKEALQLIIMGLNYFVAPNDIIEDTLPSGLGLEDDAAVLEYVIKQVNEDLKAYKVWKKQQ